MIQELLPSATSLTINYRLLKINCIMERNESDEEAEGQQPEIRIRICGYSGQLSDYLVDAVRWDQVDVAQVRLH